MTSQPRNTPLRSVHERLGATMTDFAGWLMPLRYGSETAEHNAVRTAAGLFDLSHMGEIAVTGPDAADALDYALVGQPSTLEWCTTSWAAMSETPLAVKNAEE